MARLLFLVCSAAFLAGHGVSGTASELASLVQPAVRGSLLARLSDALPAVNASCQCSQQTRHVVRAALDGHLWALKWVDASARLPAGLLSGNVNQLGDYDECLGLDLLVDAWPDYKADCPSSGVARPAYCLASVALDVPDENPALAEISRLLHSHTPFRSSFNDIGHRVPRFSAAYLGVCAPAACSGEELRAAMEYVLNTATAAAAAKGLAFRASVPPEMCRAQGQQEPADSFGAWLARCALWWTVAAVAVATFIDVVCLDKEGPAALLRIVHCVSARRNWQRMTSTAGDKDGEVAVLNGVRGINALGLLVAHKSVAMLYQPYANRTAAVAVLGRPWSVIGRVAILYTDCFILLSGALAARSLLRQLDRTGSVNILRRMLDRYVRLTPLLVALMVLCTLLLPGLGGGPMWGMVVTPHAALCRQHWWRNVLYVHNLYGFEEMCLTHTHQLGIDMQLFAVAPLLVYPVWRWPRLGAGLLAALAAWSTALRHGVVLDNKLSTIVYFGVPVSDMFRTANLSYILPTHRLTVYVMGVALGYALHRVPESFRFSRAWATLGWLVFVPLGLLPVLGPYETGTPEYRYDAGAAALYAAFAPILWSAFVCWGTLACARDAGGLLQRLVSWRGWSVFAKFAFALYLTQFPVFFYNVGTTKHVDYYNIRHLLNIGEFAVIFAASIVLSLTFEMPFLELWKLFTKERKDASRMEHSKQNGKGNLVQNGNGVLKQNGNVILTQNGNGALKHNGNGVPRNENYTSTSKRKAA
ncbi:O-acyltransferase like protein-like [Thrips palmi]|uniref:O-acyltransferase like protein-like n=1 Tax=Thrips palmi TaxID=161013 RepID=A0A6P8ZLY9_THRPL|nr:O-acyltransferase like protein-like [Thrips palmi]XP_034239685.1 O-acyltransferase like protein-like [Thrips palmi]